MVVAGVMFGGQEEPDILGHLISLIISVLSYLSFGPADCPHQRNRRRHPLQLLKNTGSVVVVVGLRSGSHQKSARAAAAE